MIRFSTLNLGIRYWPHPLTFIGVGTGAEQGVGTGAEQGVGIIAACKVCHTACWIWPNCANSGRDLKVYGLITSDPTLLWIKSAGTGVHCRSLSQARVRWQIIHILTYLLQKSLHKLGGKGLGRPSNIGM